MDSDPVPVAQDMSSIRKRAGPGIAENGTTRRGGVDGERGPPTKESPQAWRHYRVAQNPSHSSERLIPSLFATLSLILRYLLLQGPPAFLPASRPFPGGR